MASTLVGNDAMAPLASKVLDLRGPRGACDKPDAEELVAGIVAEGGDRDFDGLCMSTRAYCKESAEVVGAACKLLPNLTSVNLSDIIAGRPEAIGLDVYKAMGAALRGHQLREIDLSNNAVGPKGLAACKELLEDRPELERLFFCNCGISAEAGETIEQMLTKTTPTNLRVLHFWNNMSGDGGAEAIARVVAASPRLESFRFSSTRVGPAGGAAMFNALADHCADSIRDVDLKDNIFADAAGPGVVKLLRSGACLRRLVIGDLSLGTEFEDVARALLGSASRLSLEELCIGGVELEEEHAAILGALVRHLPRLQTLDASDNEFGDPVACLARALDERRAEGARPLQSLALNCTYLSFHGAGLLIDAMGRQSCEGMRLSADELYASDEQLEGLQAAATAVGVAFSAEEHDPDSAEDVEEPDVPELWAVGELFEVAAAAAAGGGGDDGDAAVQALAAAVEEVEV